MTTTPPKACPHCGSFNTGPRYLAPAPLSEFASRVRAQCRATYAFLMRGLVLQFPLPSRRNALCYDLSCRRVWRDAEIYDPGAETGYRD